MEAPELRCFLRQCTVGEWPETAFISIGEPGMRESLIDSIGRESALKLMGDAVLQAIEESSASGVLRKAETAQVTDGPLCVVEDDRQSSLVADPSRVPRSLSKQVPIA